eukprot:CAMPEP_0172472456 /NCGR_PEP_ID=MMETSP1065-20121228/68349_1 /TAXON_ID=265537 /ORGANISM="Amphiprora paludosa, Strain CCMP125" /LENGTH=145 /DNA_ID=CAMNT_0013230595 /DNA_START=161 /DNA_END=598 /DNA_ORIENTATION=-
MGICGFAIHSEPSSLSTATKSNPFMKHIGVTSFGRTPTSLEMVFGKNKQKNQDSQSSTSQKKLSFPTQTSSDTDKENAKEKALPAMLVLYPMAAVLGVDIVLNLGVLVKRTFDFFILGKARVVSHGGRVGSRYCFEFGGLGQTYL